MMRSCCTLLKDFTLMLSQLSGAEHSQLQHNHWDINHDHHQIWLSSSFYSVLKNPPIPTHQPWKKNTEVGSACEREQNKVLFCQYPPFPPPSIAKGDFWGFPEMPFGTCGTSINTQSLSEQLLSCSWVCQYLLLTQH